MTDFNKRIKHSASDLDNYCEDLRSTESRSKKNYIENFILLFLIIFGALGTWATSSQFSQPSEPKTYLTYLDDDYNDHNTIDPQQEVTASTQDQVSIKGRKETNEEISFVIKGYDPTAMYILKFGDGEEREIKCKEVIYRYPRAGFYEVNLLLKYGEGIRTLFSKELNITNAPEEIVEYIRD